MNLRQIVGENVRAIRIARGLSQDALSQKAHLARTYVSALENGEINITVDTIEQVAMALEVHFLVLMIDRGFHFVKKRVTRRKTKT